MPAQRESCRSTSPPCLVSLFPREDAHACLQAGGAPPTHAVPQGRPSLGAASDGEGTRLCVQGHMRNPAPWGVGRRGSRQDAVALIPPPHMAAEQQRGAQSQGSLLPRPPWHHQPEQAEITLISQIGAGVSAGGCVSVRRCTLLDRQQGQVEACPRALPISPFVTSLSACQAA